MLPVPSLASRKSPPTDNSAEGSNKSISPTPPFAAIVRLPSTVRVPVGISRLAVPVSPTMSEAISISGVLLISASFGSLVSMTTSSSAVGTAPVDQLEPVNQSLEVVPTHSTVV